PTGRRRSSTPRATSTARSKTAPCGARCRRCRSMCATSIAPRLAEHRAQQDHRDAGLGCCTTGEVGQATGVQYCLSRNCTNACWQIAPRQFRTIGGSFNAVGDTVLVVTISNAYNGSLFYFDFEATTFTTNAQQPTCTYQYKPPIPLCEPRPRRRL